jgi:acetyl esterase/lipase
MHRCLAFLLALALVKTIRAETPGKDGIQVLADVNYKQGEGLSEYEKQRCKLDVYLPNNATDFPTLVWFHGGGLKNGDKGGTETDSVKTPRLARSLAAGGIAVVTPNYRLSPHAKFPAYVEDAAAAVAWVRLHIAEHGGSPRRIFIGGHSAGGYLALMLGMDAHYLEEAGVKLSDIAGFIPVSGQTMTHYTVREERGAGKLSITADEAAPVHFARATTPPFLVLYADHDMSARAEENAYFVALMKGAGNKRVTGRMIADRTHGSIASGIADEDDQSRMAILEFIRATGAAR